MLVPWLYPCITSTNSVFWGRLSSASIRAVSASKTVRPCRFISAVLPLVIFKLIVNSPSCKHFLATHFVFFSNRLFYAPWVIISICCISPAGLCAAGIKLFRLNDFAFCTGGLILGELKQYVLYLILALAAALFLYYPAHKVLPVFLPVLALWLLWQNLRFWSYSLALMAVFGVMVFSRDIYAYAFKTLRRPLWTYAVKMNFCLLITVFYASWFFSYSPPTFLFGYNNVYKRYAMLPVCFVAAWLLLDFFIFYLLAPVMLKKQISCRSRLQNYRFISPAQLSGRRALSQQAVIQNAKYAKKIKRQLLVAGKRLPAKKYAGHYLPISIPFVRTAGLKFMSGPAVYRVSASQLAGFRFKKDVVFSYDKCVSIFGLEYIKNVKQLGASAGGSASRWDRYSS